jgi:hypothetical protein
MSFVTFEQIEESKELQEMFEKEYNCKWETLRPLNPIDIKLNTRDTAKPFPANCDRREPLHSASLGVGKNVALGGSKTTFLTPKNLFLRAYFKSNISGKGLRGLQYGKNVR